MYKNTELVNSDNDKYHAVDPDQFLENSIQTTQANGLASTITIRRNSFESGNQNSVTSIPISTKEIVQQKAYVGWKRFLGLGFSIIAGLSMTFGHMLTKMMTNSKYHVVFITFIRFQGMVAFGTFFLGYAAVTKRRDYFEPIWPPTAREKRWNMFVVFLRATLGTAGISLFYLSFKYLSVADSAAILYSNPICVVFLARIFLKEPLGIVPIVMTVVAVVGIFVIARPPILTGQEAVDQDKLIGIAIALVAVILISFVLILIRYMRKLYYATFITWYGYNSTIYLLLIAFAFGYPNVFGTHEFNWRDTGIMIGVMVLNLLGQILLTLAMKFENAGTVSLYRTLDIILNFIGQFIVLGVTPQSTSLIGASLICIATFTIGFRAWLNKLPVEHSARQKFALLLK